MLVVERREVVRLLRLLRQRDVVALGDGSAPGQVAVLLVVVVLAPPVQCLVHFLLRHAPFGLVAVELVDGRVVAVADVKLVEQGLVVAATGHARVIDIGLVVDDVARRGVVHGVERGLGRDVPVGVHVDRRLVGLALLRGDDDDAVGGQCTVDAGSGGILQHRHRLHVVGVDFRQLQVGGHVVDHQQRFRADAAGEGAHAAQYRVVLAGVRVDVHAQSGHLAFQGRENVLVHDAIQLGGVHKAEGGCRAFAAKPLVAGRHHDGLGQLGCLLVHLHVDCPLTLDGGLVRLHADVAEQEHGVVVVDPDAVAAFQVGHGRMLAVFHGDGHAIDGFTLAIRDNSFYFCLGKSRGRCHQKEKCGE